MLDWLNTFLTNHQQLIGLAIFLIVFFDCLAIVGLAIPGNTMLVIASAIAGSYNYPLWQAIFLGVIGGWLGDIISYGLGYKLKDRVYNLKVIKNNPQWVDTTNTYFQRYGVMGLILGRFVSPLRATMTMLVGIFHLPFIKFLLITFFSSMIWTVSFVVPSWATGAAFSLPVDKSFWAELISIIAILALFVAVGCYGCIKQKKGITAFMSFIAFVLLAVLYFALPYLQALDQGVLLLSKGTESNTFHRVIGFVTELGDSKVQFMVAAALCFLLLFLRQIKPLLFFAFTMFGTATLGWIIKETALRARPGAMTDVLQTFSFPSGHSSASFAFCISIGVLAGLAKPAKIRLLWLLITCLPAVIVSLSRVYLGVHWVTDIIAGGLLAAGVSMFVLTWVEFRERIKPIPTSHWKVIVPVVVIIMLAGAVFFSLRTFS